MNSGLRCCVSGEWERSDSKELVTVYRKGIFSTIFFVKNKNIIALVDGIHSDDFILEKLHFGMIIIFMSLTFA